MKMWKQIFIGLFCVALATKGNSRNTAHDICKDNTGYNCLYTTNKQEMVNVPVYFNQPIPPWLTGSLIKNGVGQFESGDQKVTHVFDGFAKISSWKLFPNSTSVFSTRFVQSRLYKQSIKTNRIPPFLLFSSRDPPFNPIERSKCILNGIDNMNINVVEFPEKAGPPSFGVLSDTWSLYQISPYNLSTIKAINPTLEGNAKAFRIKTVSSAHPLPEPGTRKYLTFLAQQQIFPFMKNYLTLVRMTSISGRSVVAEWPVSGPIPYMHSFAVTESKAILLAGPYASKAECILKTATPIKCLKWNPTKPSVLYIADFKTGAKLTIQTEALFALHHINAYEINEAEIIMDVVTYDTPELVSKLLLLDVARDSVARRKAFEIPKNRRLHVNLQTEQVTVTEMNDGITIFDGLDTTAINENYRSKEYCYVYGVANFADRKSFEESSIVKKNMCEGGRIEGVFYVPSHFPVEPTFVPNPRGATEDDGVLLVPMLRGVDAVTYLAVIDAQTMTLRTKADAPTYIPFSLHGEFFKDVF